MELSRKVTWLIRIFQLTQVQFGQVIINMIDKIYAAHDGDSEFPEIQISGAAASLIEFGVVLSNVESNLVLEIKNSGNKFFPVAINRININLFNNGNDRLTVSLDKDLLTIGGSNVAFKMLGDSLLNFFNVDVSVGEHFQLDYYEENQVLNETNCNLIFICDR